MSIQRTGFTDLQSNLNLINNQRIEFYKNVFSQDALTLQRVALQTKIQLCEDEGLVPDVRAAVQELFTSLFAAVYNHQDEEGRCYTDSLAELPEHDEVDGKK